MIAAFVGTMLIIKFYVAPAIIAYGGIAGVVLWIVACLAVGRRLED
jgi:hypothetical protein